MLKINVKTWTDSDNISVLCLTSAITINCTWMWIIPISLHLNPDFISALFAVIRVRPIPHLLYINLCITLINQRMEMSKWIRQTKPIGIDTSTAYHCQYHVSKEQNWILWWSYLFITDLFVYLFITQVQVMKNWRNCTTHTWHLKLYKRKTNGSRKTGGGGGGCLCPLSVWKQRFIFSKYTGENAGKLAIFSFQKET